MTNTTFPRSSGAPATGITPASGARTRPAGGRAGVLALALLACLSCTTRGGDGDVALPASAAPATAAGDDTPIHPGLLHSALAPDAVRVEPEDLTVENSFVLDVYTLFHSRDYRAFRVSAPGEDGSDVTAHLLLPPGDGPHPAIVVFPILAGSHVVSEALAKALVRRHYAILRIERPPLLLEEAQQPEYVTERMSAAVREAGRLLDWLETRPDIDPTRIGTAGVSFGSLLACLLHAVDARVNAGFFALTGAGLAELIHDSREKPVRVFRDRLIERHGLATREDFVAWLQPQLAWVDPLAYADRIDSASVLMLSGRFDRIMPPDRAEALWQALGEPVWIKIPTGHYQAFPLLWYAVARGADHFDERFGRVQP